MYDVIERPAAASYPIAAPVPPSPQKPSAADAVYAVGHWLLGCERVKDAAHVFRILVRIAPRDERGWLGLGQCHEQAHQPQLASQLYAAGSLVVAATGQPSVRCLLARARVLGELGQDAESVLQQAEEVAAQLRDDALVALVQIERERPS